MSHLYKRDSSDMSLFSLPYTNSHTQPIDNNFASSEMSNIGINSGCGNTAAGAITQLVATGAMDAYLSKNAKFTYWKMRHMRYTNFAMEAVIQPFNSTVAFGQTAQITLNRTGDLVYYLYVLLEIPGITGCKQSSADTCGGQIGGDMFPYADNPTREADAAVYANYLAQEEIPDSCDTQHMAECLLKGKQRWQKDKYGCCAIPDACAAAPDNPSDYFGPDACGEPAVWACWTNSIGQLLIKCASIIIGGSTIDNLYSDFLFMWEELTGKAGKRLEEMVGKRGHRTHLVCDSRCARLLYTPLPFWFTQHSGNALSLASLQFHGVQIQVEFERLENCIITSGEGVQVRNCATGGGLANSDLAAALETTYVYLDVAERQKFATNAFETLIVQLQQYSAHHTNSQARINLQFNHPVIELIFAVRRHANERCNNWFDYSGIDGRDPIIKACLNLNNQPRFQNKPGTYLRMVQPYQFHTNIPQQFIYVFSFALHPEDPSPSGSCNMSRIDHVDLVLTLQSGLAKETVTVMVFARNHNIMRFKDGLGGLGYSNFCTAYEPSSDTKMIGF